MSTEKILAYYSDTFNREVRDDLVLAAGLVKNGRVAVDCGCGSGSDIAYLKKQGFIVHAFDIEQAAIRLCGERFRGDKSVFLSLDSFSSYQYPNSDLIVADASLFFCPEMKFDNVWHKICDSLKSGGVFCGSFLGPKDTMASPAYDREAYWPDVLVFSCAELKSRFNKFDVLSFTEHNVSGHTPQGNPCQWHIFSVVAKLI